MKKIIMRMCAIGLMAYGLQSTVYSEDYFPWVRVRGAIVDGEIAVFDGPSGRYIRSGGTNAQEALVTMTNYVEVTGSSSNWAAYFPALRTLYGCHTNNEKAVVAAHTNTPAMTAHSGLGTAATNPASVFAPAAVGTNLTDHTNTPAMTAHSGLGSAATNPATAFDTAGVAATVGTNLTDHTNTPAMTAHSGLGTAATNPASAFAPAAVGTNLTDHTNTPAMTAHSGLGTAATNPATAFDTAGAAAAVGTNLTDHTNTPAMTAHSGLGTAATNATEDFAPAGSSGGFSGSTITLDDPTNTDSRWIKYVLRSELVTQETYTPPSTGTIYYVATNGNDESAGTNWDTAVATIQQGLTLAGSGNTVWVSNGVWTWTAEGDVPTLSQAGILASYNLHGAIIDGSRVGAESGFDGVIITHANAILSGFTIRNCAAWFSNSGGISMSAGKVEYCAIYGCYGYYAGGIELTGGLLENSVIFSNDVFDSGSGGGVKVENATARNCLIYGNYNDEYQGGGGLRVENGLVENCTIVGNKGNTAGGAYATPSGIIKNCIVYHNRGRINMETDLAQWNEPYDNITNSCVGVLRNFPEESVPIHGTNGCITNNPLFISASTTNQGLSYSNGNFRLQSNSPCINLGTNQSWMATALDIDYWPRIMGNVVDLGAYEYLIIPDNVVATWKTEVSSNDVFYISRNGINLVIIYPNSNVFSKSIFAKNVSLSNLTIKGETDRIIVRQNPMEWSEVASLPKAMDELAGASLNDAIYSIGGMISSTIQTNVYKYNGTNWTEMASLPTARRNPAVCNFSNAIYAMGGWNSAVKTNVYCFDGTNWTEVAGLPVATRYAAATVLSNALYFIGGLGTVMTNAVYKYDGSLWTEVASLPTNRQELTAATLGNYIYAIGGYKSGIKTNVFRFDGSTWTEVAGLPAGRSWASSITIGNYLYVIGGYNTDGNATNSVYKFDGTSWTEITSIPTNRAETGVGNLGSNIYLFGGTAATTASNTFKLNAVPPIIQQWKDASGNILGEIFSDLISFFKSVSTKGNLTVEGNISLGGESRSNWPSITNQVITYLGVAYTITNDPSATGDVLKFDPTTSNAWFAAPISGSTTNLAGMVWDNGGTTGTLIIVNGSVTVTGP